MKYIVSLLVVIVLGIGIYAFSSDENYCVDFNALDFFKCMAEQEVRSEDYWKERMNKKLVDKVFLADKKILKFMEMDNQYAKIDYQPEFVKEDLKFMLPLVKSVLGKLPEEVKKKLDRRFGGILLLENFGGSGYSTTIVNDKLKIVGSFLVLDPRVLNQKANDWHTWKENSPFKKGAYHIVGSLQNEENNTIEKTIEFMLLHELAHIITYNLTLLKPDSPIATYEKYYFKPFYQNYSWRGDRRIIPGDNKIDKLSKVKYYFGDKLDNKEMIKVYDQLETTAFATLYGATNVYDDFAEAFATYVHVKILKQPWKIQILKNDKIIKTITHCWDQDRCKEKKEFFQSFFAN